LIERNIYILPYLVYKMERKVIGQGNDTLTITLPREWTRKYSIKAGDALNFDIKNESLEIRCKGASLEEPINIYIDFTNQKLIKWTLGSLYRMGFEEIHIEYDNPTIFNLIQKLIKDTFVGFIITRQEKNLCIIKSMTTDDSKNLPSLMRRSFLVAVSLAENCYGAIKKNKFSQLQNILYLHDNTDQLIRLCQRLIIKNSYADVGNANMNMTLLENLELVCDDYRDICKFVYKKNKSFKGHDKIIALLDNLNKIFDNSTHIIFNYKEKEIISLISEIEENNIRIDSCCSNKNSDETIFLFYLKSISNLIRNFFPTIILGNISNLKK
jgi:phosphate uptake regulator